MFWFMTLNIRPNSWRARRKAGAIAPSKRASGSPGPQERESWSSSTTIRRRPTPPSDKEQRTKALFADTIAAYEGLVLEIA